MFAEKQAAAMREDRSEEAAYGVARAWLIENGRDALIRMGVITDAATAAAAERRRYEAVMAAQAAAARAALREGLYARQRYRLFLEPEEAAAVAARALSSEPWLPHSATSDDEGAPELAAAGSGVGEGEGEVDVLDSGVDAQAALVRGVLGGGGGAGPAEGPGEGAGGGRSGGGGRQRPGAAR